MAEEDKVKWKLGTQKMFNIEGVDRPNQREMMEYITGQKLEDFYNTASESEQLAITRLASGIIYGGRGSMVSASQWDQLLSSPEYQKKMQQMGADTIKAAGGNTREDKLRLKALGLQAQADLPEGNLPVDFNKMPRSATPMRQKSPSITASSADVSDDEADTDAGGLLTDTGTTPFRKRRSLIGR